MFARPSRAQEHWSVYGPRRETLFVRWSRLLSSAPNALTCFKHAIVSSITAFNDRCIPSLLASTTGSGAISELKQLMGDAVEVEDALTRLLGLGLIHKVEDCVFATRATVHVHKLAG